MRSKFSAFALFLLAALLLPRVSVAGTVTMTLESVSGDQYGVSIQSSPTSDLTPSSLNYLTDLNNDRSADMDESWTATDVNLETLISTRGDTASTSVGGLTIGQLKEDAYLDSQFGSNSITNLEVQDAIFSVLDGSCITTGLTTSGEDNAVENFVSLAASTSETSAFYSQFTYYYPETWGTNLSTPQQFLSFAPISLTPEPSSLLLLGTGLAGLAGAMRFRSKHSHKA